MKCTNKKCTTPISQQKFHRTQPFNCKDCRKRMEAERREKKKQNVITYQ